MLALKTEFPLKFFTVLIILFTFRIFEQLALALRNRVALKFFILLKYLYHSAILSNLRLLRNFSARPHPASYAYGSMA